MTKACLRPPSWGMLYDMNMEAVVSVSWMLRLIRFGFSLWLILYGLMALLSPNSRVAESAITDIAIAIHFQPHHLLATIFMVPGIISFTKWTRSIGLVMSTGLLSIYEIGLIISAIRGDGTFTAPVTFAFATVISAFLLTVRDIE